MSHKHCKTDGGNETFTSQSELAKIATLTRVASISLFSHASLVQYFNQLLGSIECQKNKNGLKKVKTHTPTRAESPSLNQNLKLLKCIRLWYTNRRKILR